jgi:hypothetical protein
MDDRLTPGVFDSPAVMVLCALEADGFRVGLADDSRLTIAPRSRLTAERMAVIARHLDAIRQLVRCRDDGVQERRDVFACQFGQTPAPAVPAFLFRPGVAYVPGVCFSGGDTLPALRFSRCWRCALAWRLVVGLPTHLDITGARDQARVAT